MIRPCFHCGAEFVVTHKNRKYCCIEHRPTKGSTEEQYASISGNWIRYLKRAIAVKKERHGLTAWQLMDLLEEQDYKCALTGVTLTCELSVGNKSSTNLSLDRINPGGPYSIENIQLVCSAINKFRGDLPLGEFIEWCHKVSNHGKGLCL